MAVFIDVNIFMYAAGRSHPHQEPSQHLLERVGRGAIEAASDVEILQEVLYRYWHIGALEQGIALAHRITRLLPALLIVNTADMLLATELLRKHAPLEPRDAVHLAVMLRHGITKIYTFDHVFDRVPGITRLEP